MRLTVAPKIETHDDSRDEELVTLAWDGDDDALSRLLERYRGFVRSKARSYFLPGADREDVVQEGMIGLYKAIRDFDASHQASFRAFAELCVTRQIITAIKASTRHKHAPLNSYVSLHLPAYSDDDTDHEILDTVVDISPLPDEHVVSNTDLAGLQDYCSAVLSDLEAEVLSRFLDGGSYQQIALELNRHVKAIDNALQRIKRKLDTYLTSRDLMDQAV